MHFLFLRNVPANMKYFEMNAVHNLQKSILLRMVWQHGWAPVSKMSDKHMWGICGNKDLLLPLVFSSPKLIDDKGQTVRESHCSHTGEGNESIRQKKSGGLRGLRCIKKTEMEGHTSNNLTVNEQYLKRWEERLL